MHQSSRKVKSGNARRLFVGRQAFFVLLLLSNFIAILLIAKSMTLSVARDLEFVDHRFAGEPSTIRHGAERDNTPKKGMNVLADRRFGKPSTKRQHQAVNKQQQHKNPKNQTRISICFVTSQFSSSRNGTDHHLFDARKTTPRLHKSPLYHFFAFSNIVDLKASGWDIVMKDLRGYKRWTTQSRWVKFLAFRDVTIRENCEVVFFIDDNLSPKDDLELFQAESRRILDSPIQLAQRFHPDGGGAEGEFERILSKKKDLETNVHLSLQWLKAQQDYDKNCMLYDNSMFGYAMNSIAFKNAAYFFWHHYSKEEDSWTGKKEHDRSKPMRRRLIHSLFFSTSALITSPLVICFPTVFKTLLLLLILHDCFKKNHIVLRSTLVVLYARPF
jgi:hypothetical protein